MVTEPLWRVELPAAEARWLTGPTGPLGFLPPGSARHDPGNATVTLRLKAVNHLIHLGMLDDGQDGRITREGDHGTVLVMRFGRGDRDAYEVFPVEEEQALTGDPPAAAGRLQVSVSPRRGRAVRHPLGGKHTARPAVAPPGNVKFPEVRFTKTGTRCKPAITVKRRTFDPPRGLQHQG